MLSRNFLMLLISFLDHILLQIMIRERVRMGSLAVVFFLRELCFWFLIALCALSRRAGHGGNKALLFSEKFNKLKNRNASRMNIFSIRANH